MRKRLFYPLFLGAALCVATACSDDDDNAPGTATGQEQGKIADHGYVDLGLSVKWATCNVGAENPEERGGYYAWGEVVTTADYTKDNSLTYGLSKTTLKSQGIVDEKGNLTPAYDAASANWGGSWRMPTSEEIDELRNKCSWTLTTLNGVNGYKVTGANGNSIFLPTAGVFVSSSLESAGSYGRYWSSTVGSDDSDFACELDLYGGHHYRNDYSRCYGQSVRPVLGHDYVDLGLSVKWATCNVGADSPEDYGDYYAWGEVTTKSSYTESSSLTYGKSFSDLQFQGIIDEDGKLTPAYDAASVNWGGSWRMPTSEEIDELRDQCKWTWTTMNGKDGYKVTGANGNSIFLPAAGYRYGSSLNDAGSRGDYWSASVSPDDSGYAYDISFGSGSHARSSGIRNYGQGVRPVSE